MRHTNTTTTREVAKDFQKLLEKENQAKKLSAQLEKVKGDIDLLRRVIQQRLSEDNYIQTDSISEKIKKGENHVK